jgi:RecA-family ATPase
MPRPSTNHAAGEQHEAALRTATEDVRTFLNIIAAQAQHALRDIADPGFLQMSRLHPTSKQFVPTRYDPSATDTMADDAISDSDAGRNVYLEGRTVRPDLKGPERGKFEDTAWVWAFVVDSDSDKNKSWSPTPAQAPSLVVETSPGNHHFWFFLDKAIRAAEAKALGDRIRASVGADHASGNVVQPYRVAGTINFPTLEKEKRGRFPTPTRVINHQGTLWAPADFVVAFPVPEKKKPNGTGDGQQREADQIPDELMKLVRDGVPEPDRSDQFHHAVGWLKDLGWTVDGITTLLETYPDGIAAKYAGRIRTEVERSWDKLEDKPPSQDSTPPFLESMFAEELEQREVRPVDWILKDFILARAISGVFGDGGVGKDLLLFLLSTAMACELPFLGHDIKHGRVIYFVVEDDLDELRRRQHAITEHFGIRCADFPRRLKIVPLIGRDTVLAAFDSRAGVVTPRPLFDIVRREIGEFQPLLTIVPNRVNMFGVNQNDDSQARQCMQLLASLPVDFGTGVVMPSHTSLRGLSSGDGTSGSVQWNNGCRLRTYLRRLIDPDTRHELDPFLREWEGMKANWSPTGKIINLRWSQGLFVPDTGNTVEQAATHAMEEGEFLRMLDLVSQSHPVSPAPSAPNNAPKIFSEDQRCKLKGRFGKRALKAAMDRLLSKGSIKVEETGPASKRRSRVVRAFPQAQQEPAE